MQDVTNFSEFPYEKIELLGVGGIDRITPRIENTRSRNVLREDLVAKTNIKTLIR